MKKDPCIHTLILLNKNFLIYLDKKSLFEAVLISMLNYIFVFLCVSFFLGF